MTVAEINHIASMRSRIVALQRKRRTGEATRNETDTLLQLIRDDYERQLAEAALGEGFKNRYIASDALSDEPLVDD
jgi:hypothetical protein